MKVAVITDIHMRNEYSEEIKQELRSVKEKVREKEPELLVLLGDVIEHEETAEEDRENLEDVKSILDDLECEKLFMAGNHDSMNLGNEELEEKFENELWGSRTIGDQKLIFLNTSSPWLSGSRGEVSEEQLEFLDSELEDSEDAVVLVHHPIHYHNVQDTYWWTNYPERAFCGNKKEINDVIERHGNVKLVLNGHLHENDFTEYKNIPHITLNAFSKETYEKPVTGTYSLIKFDNKIKINVKTDGEKIKNYIID